MSTRFPNGLIADLTGNVTGNVTGNITGSLQRAVNIQSASGTITPAGVSGYYLITKAGVGTITLAAPTATTHDGIEVTLTSTTANAHLVTHGGTLGYNAGGTATDVATFGGAIGDSFTVFAYNGAWYTKANINVTLG